MSHTKISKLMVVWVPAMFFACQVNEFSSQTPTKKNSGDAVADADGNDTDKGQAGSGDLDGGGGAESADGEDGGSDGLGNNDSSDDLIGENDEESGSNFKSGDAIKDLFTVESNKGRVDVIMFFDQSGSMQKYISEVAQRLGKFIESFTKTKKNLDYRMLVVAKDFSLGIQSDRVGHVQIGIGNHNAVDVFKDLITGKVSSGKIRLRKKSTKEFIIVSNDNSSQTAPDFGTWAKSNRNKVGRIHINGFIGFKSTGPLGYLGPCYIDKAGTNYIEMTKHKSLGGMVQDMCSGDWDALMNNLGKKISEVASNVFDLSEEPVEKSILVKLNGTNLASGSWNYDTEDNSIEVTAKLEPTDKISISYDKK